MDLREEIDDALLPFLAEEPFRRSATCSARTATLERRSRQAAWTSAAVPEAWSAATSAPASNPTCPTPPLRLLLGTLVTGIGTLYAIQLVR
ncbi:hypothetical protein QFZ66_005984 [Streptomyces sp. B4I13]|nr:hypothetical protein [Streptomyces sp. B4I13]